jgi:hypothetical protein
MRTIFYLIVILFLTSCSNDKKERSMETPPPPAKVTGCDKFKTPEDCVTAKEINFTLAYILGSKAESQVFSLSKMDNSRDQITKIKTSSELDTIRKRFNDEKYYQPGPNERATSGMEELVQFIQDDMEGQGSGRSALQVKNDRIKAIKEAEEKRRLEESEANRKLREKMQKDIDANPYQFEISCLSNTDDDAPLGIEQCGLKLKPVLKVTSDNKIIYNYTFLDFLNGTFNINYRLPKEFSFELSSTSQDSSKLLVVTMKERVLKDDPNTGKITFSVGKMYTKMGQNLIFVP